MNADKRRWVGGASIAAVLCVLCVSVANPQVPPARVTPADRPDRMGLWSVRGNVYRNDYFGLSYTFPKEMSPESKEVIPKAIEEGLKIMEQQEPGAAAKIKEVVPRMVPLLSLHGEEMENNLKRRIQLIAMDISDLGALSVEELLNALMRKVEQAPTFRLVRAPEDRQYGARKFREIRYTHEWTVEGRRLRFYNGRLVTIAGTYALLWSFTAGSEKSLAEIMAPTDAFRFDPR